jgi:sigma-E factor negative regulatory protein RseB
LKRYFSLVLLALSVLWASSTSAQTVADRASAPVTATGVERWLMRLHEAARQRAYVGTFVVTAGPYMSSSRIWHVDDGQQQIERVEALSGAPRSTFRRNDEVVTFLPDSRTVINETREALGLFPNMLNQADASVARFYRLKAAGQGRVAGLGADIVQLLPTDALRFGYRIWTEHKTGLVIKLQTLDAAQQVLEQAAFSEIQLDAPVAVVALKAMMANTQGYRVHSLNLQKTTVEQEGWMLDAARVPGFTPVHCYKRVHGAGPAMGALPLQCIYSDGLASVSVFVEPYDATRHTLGQAHDASVMGATHMRVRQIGNWWLTAVGEVPPMTLTAFVQALDRKN